MKPVIIHGDARAEFEAAMLFYEERAPGLGLALHEKVEAAVRAIQTTPESWPPHKKGPFRKYFVERFPFTVFYLELADHIWVLAIAHASRRPGYWNHRKAE